MNVGIIGAGNSGLAMASHLSFVGHSIYLWNRSEKTIEELKRTKIVKSKGAIVGEFPLTEVTTNIQPVLEACEVILVTTPATSHRGLAKVMAPYLKEHHIVILNPGRTFGAIDFKNELINCSNTEDVKILETQTIIYTCRKTSPVDVNIIALKREVLIATFRGVDINEILERIPDELNRFYKPISSLVETSIGNVGMILHCAPMILNAGWVESSFPFRYYRDGISKTIARFAGKIDAERLMVAKCLDHPVISVKEWMQISYNLDCDDLYSCIQNNPSYDEIFTPKSLTYRYIYEDIPFGLVPLESMGINLGLPMKNTTLIIDMANSLLDEDLRAMGRTADKLNFDFTKLIKGIKVEDIEEPKRVESREVEG